ALLDAAHFLNQLVAGSRDACGGLSGQHSGDAEEFRGSRHKLLLESDLGKPVLLPSLGLFHEPLLAADRQAHVLTGAGLRFHLEESVGMPTDDDTKGPLEVSLLDRQLLQTSVAHIIEE